MNLREWEARREELLGRLRRWRGDTPERGESKPHEIWRREYATHTEVKLTYEGEPGERIPAYLLVPRADAKTRRPAVFAAHQCACQCDVGKEQVVGKSVDLPDQAYGLELVREGFVVLAPDANKVGERYDAALRRPWETAHDEQGKQRCCTAPGGSWGPVRWKPVYDVMRGIDFLSQHETVDPDRIGMIGHSLGADTTIWSMPFDDRIRAAAISGGGLMIYGRWLPYGLPYEDVLSLIAPRPFFEVAGAWDAGVNWPGREKPGTIEEARQPKRQALARARAVYALYGKGECLDCFEFEGGHTFPREGRKAAYAWLKRWLQGPPASEQPDDSTSGQVGKNPRTLPAF